MLYIYSKQDYNINSTPSTGIYFISFLLIVFVSFLTFTSKNIITVAVTSHAKEYNNQCPYVLETLEKEKNRDNIFIFQFQNLKVHNSVFWISITTPEKKRQSKTSFLLSLGDCLKKVWLVSSNRPPTEIKNKVFGLGV